MKLIRGIMAVYLAVIFLLPATRAEDITSQVQQQLMTQERIKTLLIENIDQVLAARRSENPVGNLLAMCWELDSLFRQGGMDYERFALDNTYYTTSLISGGELTEYIKAYELERAKAEEEEAARILALEEEQWRAEQQQQQEAERLELDYARADLLQKAGLFDEAADTFLALNDYLDAQERARECLALRNSAQYKQAHALMEEKNYLEAYRVFSRLAGQFDADARAQDALQTFIREKTEGAIQGFSLATINYRNFNELVKALNEIKNLPPDTLTVYHQALFEIGSAALQALDHETSIMIFDYLADNNWPKAAKLLADAEGLARSIAAVTGGAYPFFIQKQGTVTGPAVEVYPDSATWRNVTDAGTNLFYAAALHTDGTVSIAPNPFFYGHENNFLLPLPDVAGWKNIKTISIGATFILGVSNNGRAYHAGSNAYGQLDYQSQLNVEALYAGQYHSMLQKNGNILAFGNSLFDQLALNEKTRALSAAAGAFHSLMLMTNGKVVAAGLNGDGQCEVRAWQDITGIAAGAYHSVGLAQDGTVVAVGSNADGQCEVQGWQDVVDIAAGPAYTVGLTAEGTVLSTVSGGQYKPYTSNSLMLFSPSEWQNLSIGAARNLFGIDTAEVGSLVNFGSYEQDNDTSNGAEPIAWRVLKREQERVLLLSEVCLDARPYHTKNMDITWAESDIRSWLNGAFIDSAFDGQEQLILLETTIVNKSNAKYKTNGGKETQDKVFLLSQEEAEKFFTSLNERKTQGSILAVAGMKMSTNKYVKWWLRSPGSTSRVATTVNSTGTVLQSSDPVSSTAAIRPAIWVSTIP